MADILNSIIHSSDNAVNGLYNAMSIRRQREQDTRAVEQNAYARGRDQEGDKRYHFDQAAKIVGGRPENVQQGLAYLRMNGGEPDPRVGKMLVSYGQSGRGGDAYGTIVWGEDAKGNPIAMQPTKNGQLIRAPLPAGVSQLTVPMQNINLQDQVIRVPSRGSSGPAETYSMGVSPNQQPGLKGAQRDAVNAADIAAVAPRAAAEASTPLGQVAVNDARREEQAAELSKQQNAMDRYDVINEAEDLLDETNTAIDNVYGTVRGQTYTATQESVDAEAKIARMTDLLTTANLGKMKGVLSETDMKILERAGSILKNFRISPSLAREELRRVAAVMRRYDAIVNPSKKESVNWADM